MNWKHLLWIVPMALAVGCVIGYFIGVWGAVAYMRTESGIEKLCALMVS